MVKHETFTGAKGLILNGGRILILVKPNGDLDLPGGRVEINESFKHCISREVYEETALFVSEIRPVASWSFSKKTQRHKINGFTYLCSCNNNRVKLSKEHIEFFWVDAEDILRFKFHPPYGLKQIFQKKSAVGRRMTGSGSCPRLNI